jgi:hypothetical protein
MALIFLGSTECGLCHKVLNENDNVVGLPPSSKVYHELYDYFDQGYHEACFENWDKKTEILALVDEERNRN